MPISSWFEFVPSVAASLLRRAGSWTGIAALILVAMLNGVVAHAQPGKARAPKAKGPVVPPPPPWTDLLYGLDIYNPRFVMKSGNWNRDEQSLKLEGLGCVGLMFDPILGYPKSEPSSSRYRLEIEVERMGPGPLFVTLPLGSVNSRGFATIAIDFEGGSGPCVVDGKYFADHSLWKKRDTPLLPQNQRVTLSCEVVSDEGMTGEALVQVGSLEAFRGKIDAATMKFAPQDGAMMRTKYRPLWALCLGGDGEFRFTRMAIQGRGLIPAVRGPNEPLTKAPSPAPPAKPPRPTRSPPIANLALGVYKVQALDSKIRFQWAKLHVVSCVDGDVRGVFQWTGPEKERACEIVRGQIIGDALTLHGIDHQRYLIHLGIARYKGKVSADGKRFHDVETIVDGRMIRDKETNERFEANWESEPIAIGRGAQAAFDAIFRPARDDEEIFRHFTDYGFVTEYDGRAVIRAHQADRLALGKLVESANPYVKAAAIGMMEGEILRDAKNGGANITGAIDIARAASNGFSSRMLAIEATQGEALRQANSIVDPQAARAAVDRVNSEFSEATSRLYNAAFNNPGLQRIYINDIERTRMSTAGFRINQAINRQLVALLRERPAPAQAAANAYGQRLSGNRATIDVVLTNNAKETLDNCVFVTEFQVDPEKSKADREKQVFNERLVGGLGRLVLGLDQDATDIASASSEADYELLLCDTGSLVWLPQWRAGEKVHLRLAKTAAASWGKAARLAVWTNQTGLKESKLSLVTIAAEAKRATPMPQRTPARRR